MGLEGGEDEAEDGDLDQDGGELDNFVLSSPLGSSLLLTLLHLHLAYQQKNARPSSTKLAAFGPPTSLGSLPLELLDMVLGHLSPPDLASTCRVSSLLLPRSAATLYLRIKLTPAKAVLFLSARVSPLFFPSSSSLRF